MDVNPGGRFDPFLSDVPLGDPRSPIRTNWDQLQDPCDIFHSSSPPIPSDSLPSADIPYLTLIHIKTTYAETPSQQTRCFPPLEHVSFTIYFPFFQRKKNYVYPLTEKNLPRLWVIHKKLISWHMESIVILPVEQRNNYLFRQYIFFSLVNISFSNASK